MTLHVSVINSSIDSIFTALSLQHYNLRTIFKLSSSSKTQVSITKMSGFILTRRLPATVLRLSPQMSRTFTSSTRLSTVLDSNTISKITEKEKEITGKEGPVKGGPTAQAQKHVGEQLNSNNLSDITKGETKITGESGARQGGPTNAAQSMATGVSFTTMH